MARRRALLAVGVGLAALVTAGCGRDDFENEPRPAVPAEVNVKIGNGEVVVSPREFGAGLVNFTIANFYTEPTVLEISGPADVSSPEVPAGGNTTLKAEMRSGEYEASVENLKALPFAFTVGPERESGQDELLLP
jgi:hypothetical protein